MSYLFTSKFRALVGSANWIIILGRFDMMYATTTMARFNMQPRDGHLQAMIRVFGYLKSFPDGSLITS